MSLTGKTLQFHDTLDLSRDLLATNKTGWMANVFFQDANGNGYGSFDLDCSTYLSQIRIIYGTPSPNGLVSTVVYTYENGEGIWADESYKTLTFIGEPNYFGEPGADNYNSAEIFEAWINANMSPPLVEYLTNNEELTSIADAIRAKGGTSASMSWPTGFVSAINDVGPINQYSVHTSTISEVSYGLLPDALWKPYITAVELPNCSNIGSSVFSMCSNLSVVSCLSVNTIHTDAFAFCSKLTEISFPNAIYIYSKAFANCTALTTASFPSVCIIDDSAFYKCSALTTAVFPSASCVGENAFCDCELLSNISFPALINISYSAFQNCKMLENVFIPSVQYIDNCAFSGCEALKTVSCPAVCSIGQWAFYGCKNLSQFFCDASLLADIKDYAFAECSSLLSMPFVPATIGSHVFEHCISLSNVDCSECLGIPDYTFNGCSALSNISCSNAMDVGSYAFASCTTLQSLFFNDIWNIGEGAFLNCPLMSMIVFMTDLMVPTLGSSNAFSNNSAIIYVSDDLIENYKTDSVWSYFSSRIKGVSELPT